MSNKPIMDIEPFINLNYNTVPLNGKHIKRSPKGNKEGFSFPTDWYNTYSKKKNTLTTPIGGLLTGNDSIVAIDCDCNESWKLFRELDPTNTATFISRGKLDKEGNLLTCGTILYQHTDNLPSSKHIKGTYDIDFYNGTGMVFLPTALNESKEAWYIDSDGKMLNQDEQEVTIKTMPNAVKSVLNILFTTPTEQSVANTVRATRTKGYLGKVLPTLEMDKGIYNPKVTKILTPHKYRNELYKKQGHISPDDVGVRHDYLFSIMCHLAGDNTVDTELARDTIEYINSLMTPPRPAKQLDREIIAGIISGRQKNSSGESYWQYDEHWEENQSWTIVTRRDNDLCDIFYDPFKKMYHLYNTVTDKLDSITQRTILIQHLDAIALGGSDGWKHDIKDMATVDMVVEPTRDFGYLDNDRTFNEFMPTDALRILHNPKLHEDLYQEPQEFIQYMVHFIPDEQQRNYLLSLLRTKLTTFEYTPVVPYIIGVGGSGKGLIMSIIELILGHKYVAKDVGGDLFINSFNGWLEDRFIVNLNELSESLNRPTDKSQALANLKNYTGSQQFQCHRKGQDPYPSKMKAMFIMTANHNPLDVETDDRRIYYISTPNTFDSNPQCIASKDSSVIYKAIMGQINDICYWLSTEVDNLPNNDYLTAPKHRGRNAVLFMSKSTANKIAWALAQKEFKMVEDYIVTPEILFEHSSEGKVYLDNLVETYNELANSDSPDKVVKRAMKEAGFKQKQGYRNAVYWEIPDIEKYICITSNIEDEDAEDIRI